MNKALGLLNSSVGRKVVMALTGFFLFSFLIVHLYINLFLFKQDGGATYDVYAEFMATYPLLRPMEIALFAGFLLHAILGIWLGIANRKVRPAQYRVNKGRETASFSSRISFWSGVFVAFFLIVHIKTFFVTSRFFPDGRTMYDLVRGAFQNPWYVVFYLVALVFLSYHIRHGFQSACQTLGLRTGRYDKLIDLIGVFFWVVIPLGFAAMPLYFYFVH